MAGFYYLKILSFVFEYIAFCFDGGTGIRSLRPLHDVENLEILFVKNGRCSIRVYRLAV